MKSSNGLLVDDYSYSYSYSDSYSSSSSDSNGYGGGSGDDSTYESPRTYSRPKREELNPTGSSVLEDAYRRREAALAAVPAKAPLSVRVKASLEDFADDFFAYILPAVSAVFLFGLYVYAEVARTQGM